MNTTVRSLLRPLARQSRAVQLLLACDVVFHLSFYMLVPYLGSHLARLGHGAASVGFVLGVRALGQHGLSLAGGAVSDVLGARRVIVAGCTLRAASFFALGWFEDIGLILVALLASGAASALFRPALNAYVAAAARDKRTDLFAISTVLNEAGSLFGAPVGLLLLAGGFSLVCAVSGALFLIAGVTLNTLLPLHTPRAEPRLHNGVRSVLGNGQLWGFSLALSGYFILFDQMYLLIPLEVARLTGGDSWTGIFFAMASALVVVGQVPTTRLCRRMLNQTRAVSLGLAVMGAAFLLPLWSSGELLGLALSVLVLTFGTMITFPFVRELIPKLGREQALGACHGLFYTVAGIVAMFGNTLTGALYDGEAKWTPWLFLAFLGAFAAAAVGVLERRGALPASVNEQPARATGPA